MDPTRPYRPRTKAPPAPPAQTTTPPTRRITEYPPHPGPTHGPGHQGVPRAARVRRHVSHNLPGVGGADHGDGLVQAGADAPTGADRLRARPRPVRTPIVLDTVKRGD